MIAEVSAHRQVLKAPFPWFGGKSRVASLVWQRFGDVPNYVEPFCGSAAMLLSRPHSGRRIETINDADCHVANFWRALKSDPEGVAEHCDWPVNEADLHARHLWLVTHGKERVERLRSEPEYYDVRVAGWWVWGLCQWIGSGWCSESKPSQQRPHLGNAGMGVHRPSQQLPHVGDAEMSDYLTALAERLRSVRVACGDWSRVCGPSPTTKLGVTGVFLDPPYADSAGRNDGLYASDSLTVAHDVRRWCIDNSDNGDLKIALCGYRGEHDMPDSWECVSWKAAGGYGSQGHGTGRANSEKECIWFSPSCRQRTRSLFEEAVT